MPTASVSGTAVRTKTGQTRRRAGDNPTDPRRTRTPLQLSARAQRCRTEPGAGTAQLHLSRDGGVRLYSRGGREGVSGSQPTSARRPRLATKTGTAGRRRVSGRSVGGLAKAVARSGSSMGPCEAMRDGLVADRWVGGGTAQVSGRSQLDHASPPITRPDQRRSTTVSMRAPDRSTGGGRLAANRFGGGAARVGGFGAAPRMV